MQRSFDIAARANEIRFGHHDRCRNFNRILGFHQKPAIQCILGKSAACKLVFHGLVGFFRRFGISFTCLNIPEGNPCIRSEVTGIGIFGEVTEKLGGLIRFSLCPELSGKTRLSARACRMIAVAFHESFKRRDCIVLLAVLPLLLREEHLRAECRLRISVVLHHRLEFGKILRFGQQRTGSLFVALIDAFHDDVNNRQDRQQHRQSDQFHLVLIKESLQRWRCLGNFAQRGSGGRIECGVFIHKFIPPTGGRPCKPRQPPKSTA